MLNPDAVVEPVDPRWNLGCDFDKWCQEHGLFPRDEVEERIICRAIREERRTYDELREVRRRIQNPERYREKQRRHEKRRIR